MIDRNVIVYDSGSGGMFLGYTLTGITSYRVTESNEYLPCCDELDNVFSVHDKQINHFNGLTTTHPYEVDALIKLAKELELSINLIAITFGTQPNDLKCKFFVALIFEIKKRVHTGDDSILTDLHTDSLYASVVRKDREPIFLSPRGMRWDHKVDYKKLFADRDIDEITRLIKLTNQNVSPEIMQKKIEDYTHENCKIITKYAPHMENYFEQGH
jgi:hypothetical protein